jgi:hypothetical protein
VAAIWAEVFSSTLNTMKLISPQRRPPDDVHPPGELPAVGRGGLPLRHELHLLSPGAEGCLPSEAFVSRRDHLARLGRVAQDLVAYDELVVHHHDQIGLAREDNVHVVLVVEQGGPALAAHVQANQVHHDRIAPARKLHRSPV